MSHVNLIELRLDTAGLVRFAQDRGLLHPTGDEDMGYAVHAWLRSAFGQLAPAPWRLFMDRRRPTRVLGYGPHGEEELRQVMADFADPGVLAVCPDREADVRSKEMPPWRSGRRLRFEVLCSPVGREARTGIEKDLFLILAREGTTSDLSREETYAAWARAQMEKAGGAKVDEIHVSGFRLVRLLRRPAGTDQQRRASVLVRPQVLVRGELTLTDADAFAYTLGHGIGRHRAFGYGMVLVRPPLHG